MAAQQLGRLGFVGCGTIVSAVVEGLCTLPAASRAAHLCAAPLLLAPRGQSQRLRTAHGPKVEVAADNQAVLDASDTVVMGLTPQHARAALAPLRFRAGTVVVSLMHGVSPAALLALPASPPGTVVRVNPLPGVAHHSGIAAVWPPHAAVASLFGLLGAVTETAELDAFHAMHAATTVMGPLYAMQQGVAAWLMTEAGGALGEAEAQCYVGSMFAAIANDACAAPKSCDFAMLVGEQTPGGLNEQNIARLREAGLFDAVLGALSTTLRANKAGS